MNDASSAAALRAPVRLAWLRNGWPSLLVAALVVTAAVYSFAPRPKPEFPPTQVYPDRLLVNGLAQQGSRIVAVGEQGQILVADDPRGPWHSARLAASHGLTFTRTLFVAEGVVLAVGHDGVIARSTDRGENWQEVALGTEGSDPLLGIAGPYDGRVFAFGAFGLFMVSDDLGQTWQRRDLVIDEGVKAAAAAAADPDADPFAGFEAESVGGAEHLNDMTQAADGSLILVGERGLILRSTDKGETWTRIGKDVYAGSFFGVLALPSRTLLAFGMRGNAFRSTDLGKTWTQCRIPTATSLFSGAALGGAQVLLAGAGNAILRSDDDGVSFRAVSRSGRTTYAALLPISADEWLTGGDTGLSVRRPEAITANGDAS
ncbi:sialidase [Fontimonas sp. SYSU GA230001]|uniref:WD40/YVTN/BNR-like repeat-containing protein n=1 Tax=Fontimonas sp. SYSU GA230001 TaxID=3142450 RepID=UPI0032B49846